jgi:hypothetical protein
LVGKSNTFLALWHAFNLTATLFLGFLNQSGVVHLQAAISALPRAPCAGVDIILGYTWATPALALLLAPAAPSPAPHVRSNCTGYGSANWPYGLLLGPVALHEKAALHACRQEAGHRPLETLVVVPGHLIPELQRLDAMTPSVKYRQVAAYWPSLSVEALFLGDASLLDLSPASLVRGALSMGTGGWGEGWLTLALVNVTCRPHG